MLTLNILDLLLEQYLDVFHGINNQGFLILSHEPSNNILTQHMLGFFFLGVVRLNTKSHQRHSNFLQINSMFCVDYSSTSNKPPFVEKLSSKI